MHFSPKGPTTPSKFSFAHSTFLPPRKMYSQWNFRHLQAKLFLSRCKQWSRLNSLFIFILWEVLLFFNGWLNGNATYLLCPPCLKWTSMPWWLWWNFISRVRADCILLSALGIYFEAKGGVNLNNRSLEGGYLGVRAWASGPQFTRSREGSVGTQEALCCLPSSSSLSWLFQALTA